MENGPSQLILRPSLRQYAVSMRGRRKQNLRLIAAFAPAIIGFPAAAFFISHGNFTVVLLVSVAMLLVVGLFAFWTILYVARVRINISGPKIVRHGWPFRRYELAMDRTSDIARVTIDFGYGAAVAGWLLSDAGGQSNAWLSGEIWSDSQVQRIAQLFDLAIGGRASEIAYADLRRIYGSSTRLW